MENLSLNYLTWTLTSLSTAARNLFTLLLDKLRILSLQCRHSWKRKRLPSIRMGSLKDFATPIFLFTFIIKQCQTAKGDTPRRKRKVALFGYISTGKDGGWEGFWSPELLDTVMNWNLVKYQSHLSTLTSGSWAKRELQPILVRTTVQVTVGLGMSWVKSVSQ